MIAFPFKPLVLRKFRVLMHLCLIVSALSASVIPFNTARGADCGDCICEDFNHFLTRSRIFVEHEATRKLINDEFEANQNWIVNDFFKEFVAALMMMTEQLATNAMNQMLAVGAIFDAKEQMDAQRVFQQKTAEAHKDYQTNHDMCIMGTAAINMASAEARGRLTAAALSKRSMERQLGNAGTAANISGGDSMSRLEVVRSVYCNPNDNYYDGNVRNTEFLCNQGAPQGRRDDDINYGRLMGERMTLDVNMADADLTNDEQDLFALSNYLYVNHPFTRSNLSLPAMDTIEGQEAWMDVRSVIAKHLMAENSFNNIMAMKTASAEDGARNGQYLAVVFERMGLSQDDARKLAGGINGTGEAMNTPSYYSMLQILSQSIYQTPSFFINLYDTPANVTRKDVAMQAINLMLDREKYKSELRTEGLLAQVLEMEVVKAQQNLSNIANRLARTEKANPPP